MQRTWKKSCSHLKLASVLLYVHYSFKVKCAKNWYRDVSSCVLRTVIGFCMVKSVVDLDVNIVLSKYGFNGVAPLEIVRYICLAYGNKIFCMYLPFQVRCMPNSILWRNPALSKSNVRITLRISNAIYRLAL